MGTHLHHLGRKVRYHSRVNSHPTENRRSYRRSALIKARTSPEVKARAEAAAAAAGMTFNRWLEQLVLKSAPPLLDLDVDGGGEPEEIRMAG